MARSGWCSVPRVSAARMSGTGSATIPSSASASSIDATWLSSRVTTSTREPAMRRRRSAETSTAGAGRPVPLTLSSRPSRAANTSSSRPSAATRARAAPSKRSMKASSWVGSWWKSARRLTPAASATSVAYSSVECPQPTRLTYSSSVYWASWITRSAPRMKAMCC